MLVLSRKKNESLIIGHGSEQIVISVVKICGDRVRLGVTASPNIPVHRKEVHDAIHRTQATSATAEPIHRREAGTAATT